MSIWFLFFFSNYIESWPLFVLQSNILTQQKWKNTDTVPDNAEYNWFHKRNCASPMVWYDLKLTKHNTQAHLLLSSCTTRLKGHLLSSSTRSNPSSYDLKLTKHHTQAHLLLSSCIARLKGHLVSTIHGTRLVSLETWQLQKNLVGVPKPARECDLNISLLKIKVPKERNFSL
jgi:hypothetical protein